jgi:hypothetical protein
VPFEAIALPNIAELREEAREARQLAFLLRDAQAVADLLAYASTLEADASRCEQALLRFRGPLIIREHGGSSPSNAFLAGGQH